MIKKSKIYKQILAAMIVMLLLAPAFVLAVGNEISAGLENTGLKQSLGGDTVNFQKLIGNIILVFLGFVGIIMVILIIYAGFLWMTAGGDSAKVDKAKKFIVNAVIGVVIIMMSYAITTYVIKAINTAVGAPGSSS